MPMTSDQVPENVLRAIRKGEVLPTTALGEFPLPEQQVENDTGINVLLDLAHHCYMGAMWGVAESLRQEGFRCVSTHACLDSVLTPGDLSLVRTYAGKNDAGKDVRPFIHWPNSEMNVVLTFQADGAAPIYTDAEISALSEFVTAGGGLIMLADINARGKAPGWGKRATWPLRSLMQHFGADVGESALSPGGGRSGWRRHA